MAISERTDLWKHVQRRAWEDAGAPSTGPKLAQTIQFPLVPRVQIPAEEPAWHLDRFRDRANAALARMEKALAAGRFRKAAKCRATWGHNVHFDRLARARSVARDAGLRLDPMGRGPVPELPTLHFRDRLPWTLEPALAYDHDDLPDRASSVLDAWNAHGRVFDRYLLAHEPPGTAPFPTHCLVGAISSDGRTGEWFVLDRWAS